MGAKMKTRKSEKLINIHLFIFCSEADFKIIVCNVFF